MWKDPDPDPGGSAQEGAAKGLSLQELSDLKDQNEQQQLLIAQLKEMLRKEQSSVTQEKVEEYVNTLSKVKAKKSRLKRENPEHAERSASSSSIDIHKKGKLNLLKQQLEENKAKLAERGKSQKGMEELVSQLKAQLNDSQQLIPLNISLAEVKPLDYNKNSTPEELYNILLTKEKKITELINKNFKQKATILDLEENLKEKDSVIDARTKAITLMTDSLSKKGKTTLDALDDTKEQMRKMQENFITLESEMKARQVKLLNDLKAKNFEITDLQENNQKLEEERNEYLKTIEVYESSKDKGKENQIETLQQQLNQTETQNNEYLSKIAELEKQLEENLHDLNRLKNTGVTVNTSVEDDNEIVKLRKQLEESNKNMIKVKAQSKSKIKELNKTIDQFKKASDSNALIVQLQAENTKLSEKIAELEEEKGNMQLKLVDSTDSMKDSMQLEVHRELEDKLARNIEELTEKDKVISLLEADIISLKEEIESLNEKVDNFSHLKNVQVTSEIKSIQIEEQLDNIGIENVKLKEQIDQHLKEKEELREKIEELKREKQEISSKLDSYIQENMELIDKLEKLSAEKVSSAESIEIVEGLTHQEKLELAAYQKNLDIHIEGEPVKLTEDDNIEPPAELNESVLQLNEDSTELLQKIDMFNMERKEVMGKMEALKEENSLLNLKIKEIENNRDILAETYEQLQTEKESLQSEYEQLVKKVRKLEEESHPEEEKVSENTDLEKLQEHYKESLAEVEELKRTLKEYNDRIHENIKLESELSQSRKTIDELNTSLKTNQDELANYNGIITENKNELINYANMINDLQNKLSARESDISDLNVIINDLNALVNNLQSENSKLGNFELMETQVAELQAALTGQIQQAQDYEEEIARNNDIITELNTKLAELNKKIIETEHEIDMKDITTKKLAQDLQDKDETIQNLQVQIEERDRKINIVVHEMKEKYLGLQKQLDGNSGSLEIKVTELTNKNKEQLEKMKKIAANLKKKSQAYQELEEKYNTEKEKWELEVNEKESIIADSKSKIASILQQLKELEEEVNYKTTRLAEAENQTSLLREIIQELEQSKIELQNSILELKRKEDKLNEVSLKQELSTSLHEDFDDVPSNQNSANEEKIKELELIIETNETDLTHYSERIHKLEEDIARLEQEKETIEMDNLRLSDQLNITSKNIEEKAMLEEELGQKLLQVTASDEALVKKLEEATEENKGLSQKNKELEELTHKLKVKVKKSNDRINQLKTLQTNVEELETANRELKKQVAILETHQKHIQDENEELQRKNQNDYERIESDYQTQLEELLKCKNDLTVECEKSQETLKEMERREEELLSEITEYKQKMEQIEANNQQTILQLAEDLAIASDNWKASVKEVESLTQQIEELNKQLVVKVAKQTIAEVISKAQEKIVEVNSVGSQTDIIGNATKEEAVENTNKTEDKVPTFHWPGAQQPDYTKDWFAAAPAEEMVQQNQQVFNLFSVAPDAQSDWFSKNLMTADSTQPDPFHPQSEAQQPVLVDDTKEALLKKIKALEFLLYNVDKEKEEALEECTGMVNELTHLVYEKVNAPNIDIAAKEIETQVMSDSDIADAAADKKQLQQIEFEQADVLVGEQTLPVIEPVAQPKRAYLTYQPEDKAPSSIKLEAFGENDDGWGWGPEEAKLEEEHLHQTESTPQVQNLKSEISRLNERVQILQVERENHLEDIKQLQIKSGKLIKKCKELKQKNDQLMAKQQSKKEETSDFFNLDETIQEELKTQVTQLEKRIKELTNELEKEKHEKGNILKRADVLTAANERMLEMKEIQDTEVLHWKRKYQELEEKLQKHEWGSDGFNEGTIPVSSSVNVAASADSSKKIEEMQQQIKELMLDNEEMQTLLDEQQQLRINAERLKSVTETSRIEEEHKLNMNLEEKMKGLEQELFKRCEELKVVFNEKAKISVEYEELQQVIKEKENAVLELQDNLRTLIDKNTEAERLLIEKDKLVRDLLENEKSANIQQELRQNISQLEQTILQLKEEKSQQEVLLTEKNEAYNELYNVKQELSKQVDQLSSDLEQQTQKYDQLQMEGAGKIEELTRKLELQKQQLIENEGRVEEMGKNYEQVQLENSGKIVELERLLKQMQEQQLKSVEADNFEVATQKYQLESLLAEKESQINELNSQKLELEGEIQQLRHSLNQKQKEYEQLAIDTEERIGRTVRELEESWVAQVDQRGADVAESWKLHLETVEAEFATLQEKLKYELNELEEKCNVLVNENNELRKNVDAEIRNEVDRISALQQQISDRQHYITELNNKLIEKQNENEALIGKLTALESEMDPLRIELANKETRLASMNIVVETTQAQFEEKREVVEEIVRILEKNTSWPLSNEKQDVLSEFQHQLNIVNEREQEIVRLNKLIESFQTQLHSSQEKDREIFSLNQLVENLQRDLVSVQEKDQEIVRLSKLVDDLQAQLNQMHNKDEEIFNLNTLIESLQKDLESNQEKDGEIYRLNQLIEGLQARINLLQEREEEILRLNQVIENYKVQQERREQEMIKLNEEQLNLNLTVADYQQKLEEFKATHIALQNSLEEKSQLIATLNQQLQLAENLKNDSNKDVQNLQQEMSQLKIDCSTLQESLSECQQQLFKVTEELSNKANQLDNVNQQLAYSQQNYAIQEGELNNLIDKLQAKEQEYANVAEDVRKTQLQDLESHYEEILAAKDLDIASVKGQLNESISNSQQVNERMTIEVNVRQQLEEKVKQLEEKISEQSALLDEENRQLIEMRSIIEQQVIKIEELRKELFEKSSDYDSLIAEIDIGRKAITQQPTPSVNVIDNAATSTSRRPLLEEDLSEPVSRAELDLALYMLHQRDVRCEELTVELTQLLEERDTLQLRLSNAIREKEEIRRRLPDSEDIATLSSSAPVTPHSKSSAIFLAASGTELASDPLDTSSDLQNLENKLSQLKSVGYKKDKTFVDEQELRRMQQISILQQHINEASKLPPEAAAKLVDATYTLSRDVQSPSKVLLNWLWGRSTPKVNDT